MPTDLPWLETRPSEERAIDWEEGKRASRAEQRPPGTIRWVLDEPERVVLKVDCSQPAILVLSDSFSPGWRCMVDGEKREILRANFLHRAVELEGGDRTVDFRYRPIGTLAGLSLSSLGMLALATAMGYERLRDRKRRNDGRGLSVGTLPATRRP